MDESKVIQALWERIEARDWANVGELLAEDLVVEWPVTGERIEGPANFVSVNSEYPEGWTIRVLRIVGTGQDVVSEVEVEHETMGLFRDAAFWTLRDGKIVRGREYWTSPGSEPAADWRAPYVQPIR